MKIDKNYVKKGMKYEVIKTILITELIKEGRKYWINLYTEFEYDKEIICSVYLFNSKDKREVIYQITNKKIDLSLYSAFIRNGGKVIQIPIKSMSDDIYEIRNKIIEVIYE
jgi:hypothetical protein